MKRILLIGISMLLMTSCGFIDDLYKATRDKVENPSELKLVTPNGEEHFVAGVEVVMENQGNHFFDYHGEWDSEKQEITGFLLDYERIHFAGDKELQLHLTSNNYSLPEVGTRYPIISQEDWSKYTAEHQQYIVNPTKITLDGKDMYATAGWVTFTKVEGFEFPDEYTVCSGTLSATFELTVVDENGNTYEIKEGKFEDAFCDHIRILPTPEMNTDN